LYYLRINDVGSGGNQVAGLLDGLGQFGLGDLENASLFESPEENDTADALTPIQKQIQMEQDYLFDKTYTCPVCDSEFKVRTVKIGKAKLIGTDMDLRPKYEGIDLLKYDVVLCPHCGYAALTRYFKILSAFQAKKIREVISKAFKPQKETSEIYSYEEALERYKLALANTIVKQGKASEKAYICLKAGWLLRGRNEALEPSEPEYEKKKTEGTAEENEFMKNALEGFLAARQSEGYPMCGMDETTVDYMIAVLSMNFSQYDVASKLIANILVMSGANPRMKEKARELKELLILKIKEQRKV